MRIFKLNWLPFDEFMQKIFNSTYHFQWHLYWLWSAQVSSVRAKLCSAFAQSGRRWWSRTWRECRGRPGLPSCRITLDNPECNCSFQKILGWGPSLSPLDFCNICNFSYILYDKWFWCSNFVLFMKQIFVTLTKIKKLNDNFVNKSCIFMRIPYCSATFSFALLPFQVYIFFWHCHVGWRIINMMEICGNCQEKCVEESTSNNTHQQDTDVISQFVSKESNNRWSNEDAERQDGIH